MKHIDRQSGFTAIELLITLFVAAAFLIAGYQLFNVVIKDGGQARSESRAGNVAYDYMRRYATSATNPCSAQTPLSNSAIDIDGLSNTRITVTISCPEYSTTSLSKIDVTMTYNTPQQTTKYSTFVNGLGDQAADVTTGLIGWWKLNGNANTSIGTAHGVVTGATPYPGQNGLENGAYSFDGVNDYIDVASISNFALTDSITVSVWVYPRSASDSVVLTTAPGSSSNRFTVLIPFSSLIIWDYGNDTTGRLTTAWSAGWLNQWAYWTFTSSATGKKIYRNGAEIATSATTVSFNPSGMSLRMGTTGTGLNPINAVIDDVRIYNRALTPSEILTLYGGGAK